MTRAFFTARSNKWPSVIKHIALPVLALSIAGCTVVEPKTESWGSYLGFISNYELKAPVMEYDRNSWPLERTESSYQRLLDSLQLLPLPVQAGDVSSLDQDSVFRRIAALEVKWVGQLADEGNDNARVHQALLIWQGYGLGSQVNPSLRRQSALNTLDQLNHRGPFANYLAGIIQLPEQPSRALKSLLASARSGYGPAQAVVGRLYLGKDNIPRDDQQARTYLKQLADNTNADKKLRALARSHLAVMSFYGVGATANNRLTANYLQSAQPSSELLYLKGLMEVEGLGEMANLSKGAATLEKAIAAGSSSAANELGWRTLLGKGVERDPVSAREYFEWAAELGSSAAEYNLGLDSLQGNSEPASILHAGRWLQRSAESGHLEARRVQAYLQLDDQKWYDFGTGLAGSEMYQARQELEEVAQLGDGWSSYALGLLSLRGQGGSANLQKGYAWLNVAVALGYRPAAPLRDAAAVQMSRPQLEQAQALSQSLFDNIRKVEDNSALSQQILPGHTASNQGEQS
ncbi:tetratricopeptide repeat protein [Parendozoicomonas sp. Alg238-R29]|uniref:tetratricopeptide repeat protein n=1 Tax=Parendozoicomonas sp. Alg238-R29 TaxID=2993446 RepID=UPI00248DBF10|nr:tetratricopeptide repeat protein [Parendozoicomonas sp. Alg238-R29]